MRLHTLFSVLFGVIISVNVHELYGQDTSNTIGRVSIASPTAASLGKFGDIPVGYYTGIPNINIPLYTAKAGSLELPVSMSYHAGGLKVQEQASWVGAGWALNAGGVITRTVVGAPDDRGNYNIGNNNVTNGHYSDFGFESYINLANGSDDINFIRGAKDGEPDLYFFNFGGYSGKFYFNDDRTPILLPEEDFKIEPSFVLGPGFTGFKITTPDGVKYYFGQTNNSGTVNPIETSIPFNVLSGSSTPATSSWFLNKIVSADGVDSIMLNYTQESYGTYTLAFSPVLASNYYPNNPTQNGINLVKNLINGVRLTNIITPTCTITFNPSSSPRQDLSVSTPGVMTDGANTSAYSLGSINITNNNGFCKNYNFNYGYFQDATPLNSGYFSGYTIYNIQTDQYRLRLDSIQEISCDQTVQKPSYKFSYFSETVPRKLSFGIDHWGYSNGVTTNSGVTTLVPTYIVTDNTGNSTVYNGATRDAAWPAMRCGTLQQITYPTGGSTSFNFEPKDQGSYTNTITTTSNVIISSLTVHMYGQSAITNSSSFTTNGTQITVNIANYANYVASLVIRNSSNGIVYTNYNIPNGTGYSPTNSTIYLNLSAGTYTYTLSLPGYGNLTGGTGINFWQWQSTSTTTTQTLLVGGLRINSITNNDGVTSNNVVTSYNYNAGGSVSTGFLYSRPTYIQVLRNDIMSLVWPYASPAGCASADGVGGHSYYVTPGSIQPLLSAQGENEGFGEVDVTQGSNGKSIYRYYGSNPWNNSNIDVCTRSITQSSVCSSSIPNFPSPPVPYDFMRGELKYDAVYNQNNQVLKEHYYFPVYTYDSLITPGHTATQVPGMFTYTEYNLQSAKKVSDSTITNNYDPNTGNYETTSLTQYFNSAYHHMPTIKNSYTSTGTLVSNTVKYAFDFRINNCDAIPDSLAVYLSTIHNDSTWLYNNIYSCSPQVNNSNNCKLSVFTQYRQMLQQARISFIGFRTRNYTPYNNTQYSCYQNIENLADNILKPVLHLQDEYINAPIETTSWKNGALLNAHCTNYGFVSNPAGFSYPVSDQLISLSSPSSSFTPATVSGTTLALDSRYLLENTVNYNAGRVADVTTRSGVTTAYIWGYNNEYPVAKITGASYKTAIGFANQTTLNNSSNTDVTMRTALNSIRAGLPNALVNTYTYAPEVGMTSETDPRGYLITHEFDALARLLRTRDKDGYILKQTNYTYTANVSSSSSPSGFTMTVNDNNSNYTGYTVSLTAVSGGSSQSFVIGSHGSNSMGPVVPGVYNIVITPPGNDPGGLMAMISISGSGTLDSSGSIATFSNITLGASNYNTINIY